MRPRKNRFRLTHVAFIVALAVGSARSPADTVYLQAGSGKPVALEGVKVQGVQDQKITFNTAAGVSNTKPLDHIPEIKLDDEPAFSTAEDDFARGDYAGAVDNYRRALANSPKNWVKDRASMRLVEAAEKTGSFDDAATAFVTCVKLRPVGDVDQQEPRVAGLSAAQLDSAIALVNRAVDDPTLGKEQKTRLLKFLLDLHGSAAKALSEQLDQLTPPSPRLSSKPAEARRPAPTSSPAGNESPRAQFEKAIEASRKARDGRIASAAEEFKAAASDAFHRLNEQRKTELEIATATFDFRIKEITKTGDLDKALAVRAEKENYIESARRDDEQLASEWTAIEASAADGKLGLNNNPSDSGGSRLSIVGQWGWHGRPAPDLTFAADGSATCVWWNGKKGTWHATDQRTFQMMQNGRLSTMTVTSNNQYALWVADHGEVDYLVRRNGIVRSSGRIDSATAHAAPWNAPSVVAGKISWPARPGGYLLAGAIRIGNCVGNHGGEWSAGDVVTDPGFVLVGGVITASGGSIYFKGTPDNPIVLKGVRIECEYTASIKAENTIFEGCTFQKAGSWVWNDGYRAKFELRGCVLEGCSFAALNRMDYGIKFEQCDFRECRFPERRGDGITVPRVEWSQINDCGFFQCKIAPSVVWMTQRCDFSGCEVLNQEDFASKTDLNVQVGVPDSSASFVDELAQKTSHSGAGIVNYTRTTVPSDQPNHSPVWKWINESSEPSVESKARQLFELPR